MKTKIKLNKAILIYFSIIIGLLFPIFKNLKFAIPIILAITLFISFLKIEFKLKNFIKKEILYYVLFILIIIPFLTFILISNLEFNLKLGLFIAIITPTAIGAPIIIDLISGNRELSISNIVIFNLMSPLSYPLLLKIYFGKNLELPFLDIFTKISLMIFIPLLLSYLFKKKINIKEKTQKKLDKINFYLLLSLITIAVSLVTKTLFEKNIFEILKIFSIVFTLSLLLFLIGFSLPGKKDIKKTLASSFGHKNTALSIWLITTNFQVIVALPILMYILCHHIINGLALNYFNKEE